MQGSELKTIRHGLGLSQESFANAIGMSRKMVHEMEAGKAAIERRTALAACFLRDNPDTANAA